MIDGLEFANRVRQIATLYLMPEEIVGETHPGRMAQNSALKSEALHGIECVVSIACIFKAMDTAFKPLVIQAITDLVFGLEKNLFWKQYSPTLIPVVQMGVNGYMTYMRLELDQEKTPQKRVLAEQQRRLWLQIFPSAVGCMYGPPRMLANSHAILQEVEVLI